MNGDRPRRGGGKFSKFSRPKRRMHPEEPLDYKNVEYLAKFISPQGKIVSRKRSGFSGQHQRRLACAIKVARHMALLPYIAGRG